MYPKRQWKARFTRSEFYRGWVFFVLYLLVFPLFTGWLQMILSQRFDFFLQAPEFSLIYYFLLLCAALLLFWSFLRQSFDILLDDLPENLTAFLVGLVGGGALHVLFSCIPLPVEDPNPASYSYSFYLSPAATVVVLVLLMPILEEIFFRGLLFGSLRSYSRGLAFAVSILGYGLFCVLPFVWTPTGPNPAYLLLLLRYLPTSAALTWCYDRGGSVWSAIALHMALNGLVLGLSLL